jgi:hypothetical protein
MLQQLGKRTKHLKGANRYKAIYTLLFPGDRTDLLDPCTFDHRLTVFG